MLKPLALILSSLILITNVMATENSLPPKGEFGVFITDLHDLDFSKHEYKVEFITWFLTDDPDYNLLKTTEITNAKEFSVRNISTKTINGQYLYSQTFQGTIKQNWDAGSYPFDTQKLIISLAAPLEDVTYSLDKSSSIDNKIIPKGWSLESFDLIPISTYYPANVGEPNVPESMGRTFNEVQATITLKRSGLRTFVTAFLGLFVATFLIITVLTVNTSGKLLAIIPLQARITLCSGSLFAAVGAIYGLDSHVPFGTNFTFSDSLEITTFAGIVFAVLSSIASDVIIKSNKVAIHRNLMVSVWTLFLISHFGVNSYLIFKIL